MKINLSRILVFVFAIFVLFIFLLSLNKIKVYDTQNLVGKNISSFELKSLDNEVTINEELLKKNKYTLINFWASWCAPCRQEHPQLMRLNNEKKLFIFLTRLYIDNF